LNSNPVVETLANAGTGSGLILEQSPIACSSRASGGKHYTSNFRSPHPSGCNFLMADGSAKFILETIDSRTYSYSTAPTQPPLYGLYQQLSTRGGSEPAAVP
jgi:prepilin-type processing-associated H-X9-DG protein